MLKINYKKKFNYNHGIMFHHFHDDKKYKKSPGSINKYQLRQIIRFIGRENIVDPKEFIANTKKKNLKKKFCLTFDDALRSQFHVALPVLDEFNIKAFFFVQTSIFDKKIDFSEVYRFFRYNYYKNINIFYRDFRKILDESIKQDFKKFIFEKKNIIKQKKKMYPFYSIEDIKFRIIRDNLLNEKDYHKIMLKMFKTKKFNYKKIIKEIFFNKSQIKKLYAKGNMIGLHSHAHTFNFDNLSYKRQEKDYKKNKYILTKILNTKINSACYPGGKFNKYSISILKKLGVECCFVDTLKQNKLSTQNNFFFTIPRQDSANILKIMTKKAK